MKMENTNDKKSYLPLIILIAIVFLACIALQVSQNNVYGYQFMNHFMGFFFLFLAMFKLFDLQGFADGFQMYDVVAKFNRTYAYLYPFIELTLGFLFISNRLPILTNIMTIIVMLISVSGVLISINKGYKFKCACLGTVLNVPLSTVSVVENVGMGLMALFMLIHISGSI
jgi:hypothetical protein